MTTYEKPFSEELTNWLIYVVGFKNHRDKYLYTTSMHHMDQG